MLWYGVALRGSSLHFRRHDMSPSQPQFICHQREHRDEKVDKLNVSEGLVKVEEAGANNKAKHIPTSQPRKTFACRSDQRGSRPVRRRWMAAATASGGWLKVKDWPSRSTLMLRVRIHSRYKDNLVSSPCLLLWRQPEWILQETIYNNHDIFIYSLYIMVLHFCFEFSKVFEEFPVDPHLCHR